MSRIVDNILAFRILTMLVTPFDATEAFKLSIIDSNGKLIKKPKTDEEKNSYDYLHRLVFNMKKVINKLPGGENKLKSIITALYLIKEQWNCKTDNDIINEEEYHRLLNLNIILAEEIIQYQMFVEDGAIVGQGQVTPATVPTNTTTGPVSTQEPVIRKKKPAIVRRQSMKQIAVDINQKAL